MNLKLNVKGVGTQGVTPIGFNEKTKKWQMELLMERLRVKSSQHRTFMEISKAMRMSMLEKRYALDVVEKSNLQKCLDNMQHCIKVTTRQGLSERLESLSRQLGLKFMEDTSGLFISSDMFYLEIILDANGIVQDVKVHHECKIEQQSCSELVNCLVKGDFADFTTQLEGLTSIYQLNTEIKIKSKAFVALQALETDLANLYMLHSYYKDPYSLLLHSSVGILQKRRGGHPMKLTYFVPPYELLDLESRSLTSLSVDLLNSKHNLGLNVTVNLEASSANKLQIQPILTFNKDQQGRSSPNYSPMGIHNSIMLPASFVLRLNKPIPICLKLKQQIEESTEINFGDSVNPTPMLCLITQYSSCGELTNANKGLFVSLPDQNHCYFMTENKNLQGMIIHSIPFTEPSHVPSILKILRQQALFNTLISSCIRTINSKQDLENTTMFEVSALSSQHISIALEHPFEESMATVEFNFSESSNIICKIYSINANYDSISSKLSQIAQKCMSIPVTLRALIKFWEQENIKSIQRSLENGNFNLPLGPNDPGGRGNEFRDIKGKPDGNGSGFGNGGGNTSGNGRSIFHQPNIMVGGSSSSFVEQNIFASTSDAVIINQIQLGVTAAAHDINYSDEKITKRRRTEDFWKSPKSELINSENMLENSNNSSDSNSLGTPTSTMSEAGVATPNSSTGFQLESDTIGMDLSMDMLKSSSDCDTNEMPDVNESESIRKRTKKSIKEEKVSLVEENKSKHTSSVSITPINSTGYNSVLTGLERRPGIEIIPISTIPAPNIKSSITITPINTSKSIEKKSSSSSNKKLDDRSKTEKKKKRKRDDSPMGPPDKMPLKQDPLSRPVSVSIKTTDGAPLSPSGLMRKFNASPVHGKSSSVSSNSSKPSPKHSPAHHSSPKHPNSPKSGQYGTSSPKHPTSGGSGKPSMSALKSAANSPSSKNEKSTLKSSTTRDSSRDRDKDKDRDREKDRSLKFSSGSSSPKLIKSTVKLKQIDISASILPSTEVLYDALSSSQDSNKSSSSQTKNRKGSLSAVIDKLKSAQYATEEPCNITQKILPNVSGSSASSTNSSKDRTNVSTTSSGNGSSTNLLKNSEYMVKPSSDGMKITINKTRTKDSSSPSRNSSSSRQSSGSSSGSNSPKIHTGLKPGVNSGPASKKPNMSGLTHSNNKLTKPVFQRSCSSGNLNASKSSSKNTSSSSCDAFSKKDRNRTSSKAGSDRQNMRPEHVDVMKIFSLTSQSQSMEGFMKTFDTKFQIPKLSARSTFDESKKDAFHGLTTSVSTLLSTSTPSSTTSGGDGATKMLMDFFSSKDKYPFGLNKYTPDTNTSNSSYTIGNLSKITGIRTSTSPKYTLSDIHVNSIQKSHSDSVLNSSKDFCEKQLSLSNPATPTNTIASTFPSLVSFPHPSVDKSPAHLSPSSESPKLNYLTANQSMRPPSAPPPSSAHLNSCLSQDSFKLSDSALDFSSPSLVKSESHQHKLLEQRNFIQTMPIRKSTPPSVQVHIVKSPVPSPLVIPSPHSNPSPCITDDELMDEALVGISGK